MWRQFQEKHVWMPLIRHHRGKSQWKPGRKEEEEEEDEDTDRQKPDGGGADEGTTQGVGDLSCTTPTWEKRDLLSVGGMGGGRGRTSAEERGWGRGRGSWSLQKP